MIRKSPLRLLGYLMLLDAIVSYAGEWHNWDRSLQCPNIPVYAPTTIKEIPFDKGPYLIRGAGHSWNVSSCVFNGVILTKNFKSPPRLFKHKGEYIVETGSGISLQELLQYLERNGRSLETFPNMPDVTIGGAIATASHGTSFQDGTISNSVVSVEVTPSDEAIPLGAYAANVGKLGVVTKLQLKTTAAKLLERKIDLIDDALFFKQWDHFQNNYIRFQAWYDVSSHTVLSMRYQKPGYHFPVLANVTSDGFLRQKKEQLEKNAAIGTASKLFLEANLEPRLEAEYAVNHSQGINAIKGLTQFIADHDIALIRPLLIRFGGTDRLPWLSPANTLEPVVFLNIDLKPGEEKIMAKIEEYMITHFSARFHWGKWYSHNPALMKRAYGEHLNQFIHHQSKRLENLYGSIMD